MGPLILETKVGSGIDAGMGSSSTCTQVVTWPCSRCVAPAGSCAAPWLSWCNSTTKRNGAVSGTRWTDSAQSQRHAALPATLCISSGGLRYLWRGEGVDRYDLLHLDRLLWDDLGLCRAALRGGLTSGRLRGRRVNADGPRGGSDRPDAAGAGPDDRLLHDGGHFGG